MSRQMGRQKKPPFAPGPWVYAAQLSASENHKGFIMSDADGGWLADISPRDADGKEGEANACLISHSPELFDMLENAEQAMSCALDMASEHMQPFDRKIKVTRDAALALLAKIREGK